MTYEEEYRGAMRTVQAAKDKVQKAGEAFPIMFIAQNNGEDTYFTAEVYDGENLVASKFVALDAGQFRSGYLYPDGFEPVHGLHRPA